MSEKQGKKFAGNRGKPEKRHHRIYWSIARILRAVQTQTSRGEKTGNVKTSTRILVGEEKGGINARSPCSLHHE